MATKKLSRSTLDAISIRSLGVIESAQIEFGPGLTVITGETGAGKTMVLTALGLVTGGKSDGDFVRANAERSVVSAEFSIPDNLSARLEDLGAVVDDGQLIISRSLTAEGKSRITVGGALSTAGKVSEMSSYLLEIHGQSSSLRLNKSSTQREILDSFADNLSIRLQYEGALVAYQELERRIEILEKEILTAEKQILQLREFTGEFSKIMPRSGELGEIENELNRLGSVEAIHTQLTHALNLLENDESGTLNNLKASKKALESLHGKDSELDAHIDKFADLIFTVEDVASELVSYLARLEADPQRFDYLQNRKSEINRLIKRFGVGSEREIAYEQLIVDFKEAENRIMDLSGGEGRIQQLRTELSRLFNELKLAAEQLSRSRKQAAEDLGNRVTKELAALSMPNAVVTISVETQDNSTFTSYTSHGVDDIEFKFSPHSGASTLPLAKIASGGEVSRLMLALEVVIASKSPVGTYIFDEVDAGVGGKAAVDVGKRLAMLAKHAQVIVVTHLPQVAVWADRHLLVHKDQSGAITESSVSVLGEESRLKEIARMLAGQEDSSIALEHAAELLETVRETVIS